jgi:hypothetical protein
MHLDKQDKKIEHLTNELEKVKTLISLISVNN